MKYVGATNAMVTLPFFIEGLTMGLISGAITSAASIGGYYYIVQVSGTFGGLWEMLMGAALVPVENVWQTSCSTVWRQVRSSAVWAACSPSAST